ncbi:hypothetical protein FSP39_021074 [Pinctada imbricata]|uniref:Uncharacterized protein n=1 Tax=Pinctada imbricata TaxID=66713 RepID=A0AA88YMA0_PINIB|nr:hypothetical protein FSP39_021074 [Pinctada imbricata]
MGFGVSKQVNITNHHHQRLRATAIVFSKEDAESVLKGEEPGTYLLYRDYDTDRLYLSVRSSELIDHHRINFEDNLYYMDNQPTPIWIPLFCIIRGTSYTVPGSHTMYVIFLAHLSARTVKAFTIKVVKQNGNITGANNFNDVTEHAHQLENGMTSVEHTNEDTFGNSKISKSSGRLWRSGLNDKLLSRMSAPVPDSYADYLGHSFRSEMDVRHSEHVYPNGFILPRKDSLDDVNDDIFNDRSLHNETDPLNDSNSSVIDVRNEPDDLSVYDTYL